MALYLLKKGCFVTGSNRPGDPERGIPGERSRLYRADDANRSKGSFGNIIETDEDLVAEDGQKFEEYKGPRPAHLDDPMFGKPPTPRDTLRDRLHATNVQAAKAYVSPTVPETRDSSEDMHPSAAPTAEPTPTETPIVKEQTEAQRREYHSQLDRMSLSDLKRQAESRGVDLKGAVRREDILKTLKDSVK